MALLALSKDLQVERRGAMRAYWLYVPISEFTLKSVNSLIAAGLFWRPKLSRRDPVGAAEPFKLV